MAATQAILRRNQTEVPMAPMATIAAQVPGSGTGSTEVRVSRAPGMLRRKMSSEAVAPMENMLLEPPDEGR